MEQLIEKAEQLGGALAEHERFKALMAARDAVTADEASGKLMAEYETQVQRIQDLTLANKPIEVDDKHKFADLEKRVAADERIKELTKAQMEFSELMNRMNRAIFGKIAPPEEPQPPSDG